MDNFVRKMLDYSKEYGLFAEGDKIVVALSGGRDSVCLLYALFLCKQEMNLEIAAVHLNHCIRGEEADGDEEYVREWCHKLGISFYSDRIKVEELAKTMHMTEEEAGRHARYKLFEDVRAKLGYDSIAVAHYRSDVAETLLFNMVRGSGAKGLAGITPKRDKIIRPILWANDSGMNEFVERNKLEFRVDRTNFDNEYSRNKIRNKVLPYLEENINGAATEHIAAAANKIRKEHEFIEKLANEAYDRIVTKADSNAGVTAVSFSMEDYAKLEEVIGVEVIKLVFKGLVGKAKDITERHYEIAGEFCRCSKTGKHLDLPYGVKARNEYGKIVFEVEESEAGAGEAPKMPTQWDIGDLEIEQSVEREFIVKGDKILLEFRVEKIGNISEEILRKDYTKCFDYGKINLGMCVRNPRQGDYFIVNSEGRKKKLSRYMIDMKIPREMRGQELVLADGSHVMWILPDRMSEAYKVTQETERVLVVKMKIN